jgi:hypothetical protein
MRGELGKVLDSDESHRRTYRNLARSSASSTSRAAHDRAAAGRRLRRALREFETLVRNWSSAQPRRPALAHGGGARRPLERVSMWIAANTVHGAQRHGPGVALPLPAGTGAAASRAAARRNGRHLGMSRFNWADGGFNSTSAPA